MILTRSLAALTLAAVALVPRGAPAQASHPLSLDATLGLGAVSGKPEFNARDGVAAGAMLAAALHRLGSGHGIAALGIDALAGIANGDRCLLTPGGGCAPSLPTFTTVAALGGWESGSGALRAMAGPALVTATGNARFLGLNAHLVAATPTFHHLGFVLDAHGTVMPNYRGDMLSLGALGAGIRIR